MHPSYFTAQLLIFSSLSGKLLCAVSPPPDIHFTVYLPSTGYASTVKRTAADALRDTPCDLFVHSTFPDSLAHPRQQALRKIMPQSRLEQVVQ
jgi:hypothetical protein